MSNNWMERADKVVMNTYGRQPLVLVKGEGCRVWDDTGKEYLDCLAGLAVVNLGHAHPEVARAAAAQLTQLVHVSNIYYTTPMVELAEALVRLSFADRVFFANSGAEVNEGAIKLVRRYSRERFGAGRHRIICMENSFHGRTLGALSATGQSKFWQGFDPLLPGFVFVPFNDLEAVANAVDDTVCAVMLEPIQGEGGVCLPSPDYLKGVRQLCNDKGLLLILDEIQTGLGRTGKLFAQENFGITPDVMTLAKALANGLPMGALLATAEVAGAFVPGTHASTFGAGPVVAAAANTALSLLSAPEFLAGVRERGAFVRKGLISLAGRAPRHQRGAGPGPHVGPGIDPGGDAGGGGLPGAGPAAQLHPGQRHPAAAASGHYRPGARRGPGNPAGRPQDGVSMTRHLLTILDLSREEIEHLLARARELKVFHQQGQNPTPLKGKTVAMIFDKPSTRTRVSFEAGIAQLGGASIYLAPGQTQMSRNEPVADTARVLSRYVDGVVVRTFAQDTVAELARHSTIPVINGLTDTHHPCQVLQRPHDHGGALRRSYRAQGGLGGRRQQHGQLLDHRGHAPGFRPAPGLPAGLRARRRHPGPGPGAGRPGLPGPGPHRRGGRGPGDQHRRLGLHGPGGGGRGPAGGL